MSYICPICDSKEIDLFLEIPQIPVYCNLLYETRQEAVNAKRADMKLGFCGSCGHVYNYEFNPDLMDYTQDYENSLHFSPCFQKYAEELASGLVRRYHLYNKDIIEIGCGDGNFLELLCKIGKNKGIGFDPSNVANFVNSRDSKDITFIRDYYSEKYSGCKADLLCCRHVLEHIHNPRYFLNTIRNTIGYQDSTVVFFEVPNAFFTIKDLGIWDLIYEHCSYFTVSSLSYLFQISRFKVNYIQEAFKSQFLHIESSPAKLANISISDIKKKIKASENYIQVFKKKYNDTCKSWQLKLKQMKSEGKRIVIWGGGSKGATFLNLTDAKFIIDYVVDINPRKHDMFISGTGQKIVPPVFLKDLNPDNILIMNSNYVKEIRQICADLKVNVELQTV